MSRQPLSIVLRTVTALLLVGSGLLAGVPGAAAVSGWSAQGNVSVPAIGGLNADSPQIAMNPAGTVAVAVWKRDVGDNIVIQGATASVVAGVATWSAAATISALGTDAGNPEVAISASGTNATVVWDTGSAVQSASAGIAANVATWTTPHTITSGADYSPHVALSSDGLTALVIWTHGWSVTAVQSARAAIDASSSPLVPSWSSVTTISDAPYVYEPQVALSADGAKAVAVWHTWGLPGSNNKTSIQSATAAVVDSEFTWSAPTMVSTFGEYNEYPQVGLSADGTKATAVWKRASAVIQSASAGIVDNVATWTAPANLSASDSSAGDAQIAVSTGGDKVTVVWRRYADLGFRVQAVSGTVTTDSSGESPVEVAAWGTPYSLSAAGQDAHTPQLALSADGTKATAIWGRDDDVTGERIAQSASATISGTSADWSTVNSLTAIGSNTDGAQIALSSTGGTALAVWAKQDWDWNYSLVQSDLAAISGKVAAWAAPSDRTTAFGKAENASLALSADGSRAIAAWEYDAGPNRKVVQAAVGLVSGNSITWGDRNTISQANPNSDAEQPQVAMAADGRHATVVWKRGDVIQSASASITNSTATWSGVSNLSTTDRVEPPQIALSADGLKATAVWRGKGTSTSGKWAILSANATIVGNLATWSAEEIRSNTTAHSEQPRVARSADGSKAVVVWMRNGFVQSAIYDAGSANWSIPVDLSPGGAWSDQPRVVVSATGSVATVAWVGQVGSGRRVIQAKSASIAGTSGTWTSHANLSDTTHDSETLSLAAASDGTRVIAGWNGRPPCSWDEDLGEDVCESNRVRAAVGTVVPAVDSTPLSASWGAAETLSVDLVDSEQADVAMAGDGTRATVAWVTHGADGLRELSARHWSATAESPWASINTLSVSDSRNESPVVRVSTTGLVGTAIWTARTPLVLTRTVVSASFGDAVLVADPVDEGPSGPGSGGDSGDDGGDDGDGGDGGDGGDSSGHVKKLRNVLSYVGPKLVGAATSWTPAVTGSAACAGSVSFAISPNPVDGGAGVLRLGAAPLDTRAWLPGDYTLRMSSSPTATCEAATAAVPVTIVTGSAIKLPNTGADPLPLGALAASLLWVAAAAFTFWRIPLGQAVRRAPGPAAGIPSVSAARPGRRGCRPA